jgi:hypothetical protein
MWPPAVVPAVPPWQGRVLQVPWQFWERRLAG